MKLTSKHCNFTEETSDCTKKKCDAYRNKYTSSTNLNFNNLKGFGFGLTWQRKITHEIMNRFIYFQSLLHNLITLRIEGFPSSHGWLTEANQLKRAKYRSTTELLTNTGRSSRKWGVRKKTPWDLVVDFSASWELVWLSHQIVRLLPTKQINRKRTQKVGIQLDVGRFCQRKMEPYGTITGRKWKWHGCHGLKIWQTAAAVWSMDETWPQMEDHWKMTMKEMDGKWDSNLGYRASGWSDFPKGERDSWSGVGPKN